MLGLQYNADLRTLSFISMYFIATYILWNHGDYDVKTIPLFLTVCLLSFIGAVATHNAMHTPMFHSQILNNIWMCILSLTYGHPVSTFVPGHNISHHGFTQLRRDMMRTSKIRYRWNFLNGLLFMPTVAKDVMWSDIKYIIVQSKTRAWSNIVLQSISQVAVLVVPAVWLLWKDPLRFLVFVHIPHLFAQWFIVTLNFLQHDGCDVDSMQTGENDSSFKRKAMAERSPNTARNFTGWITNFLFLNNGYHSIHHRYPRLHWSLAPKEHEKLIHPLIHPNLEQDNMLVYMFRACVYPGQRVTYDGKPIVFTKEEDGPDIEWITFPKDMPPFPSTLFEYVFIQLKHGLTFGLFAALKILVPTWSPVFGAF